MIQTTRCTRCGYEAVVGDVRSDDLPRCGLGLRHHFVAWRTVPEQQDYDAAEPDWERAQDRWERSGY